MAMMMHGTEQGYTNLAVTMPAVASEHDALIEHEEEIAEVASEEPEQPHSLPLKAKKAVIVSVLVAMTIVSYLVVKAPSTSHSQSMANNMKTVEKFPLAGSKATTKASKCIDACIGMASDSGGWHTVCTDPKGWEYCGGCPKCLSEPTTTMEGPCDTQPVPTTTMETPMLDAMERPCDTQPDTQPVPTTTMEAPSDTQPDTQPVFPVCQGHAATWNAGAGGCSTYAPGKSNHKHCKVDNYNGLTAFQVCPSCNGCVQEEACPKPCTSMAKSLPWLQVCDFSYGYCKFCDDCISPRQASIQSAPVVKVSKLHAANEGILRYRHYKTTLTIALYRLTDGDWVWHDNAQTNSAIVTHSVTSGKEDVTIQISQGKYTFRGMILGDGSIKGFVFVHKKFEGEFVLHPKAITALLTTTKQATTCAEYDCPSGYKNWNFFSTVFTLVDCCKRQAKSGRGNCFDFCNDGEMGAGTASCARKDYCGGCEQCQPTTTLQATTMKSPCAEEGTTTMQIQSPCAEEKAPTTATTTTTQAPSSCGDYNSAQCYHEASIMSTDDFCKRCADASPFRSSCKRCCDVCNPPTTTQAIMCRQDCNDLASDQGGWNLLCNEPEGIRYCGGCGHCKGVPTRQVTTAAPTTNAPAPQAAMAATYVLSLVGSGYCRGRSCDVTSKSCFADGYRKTMTSADACAGTCVANNICEGYAHDPTFDGGLCYIYTSQIPVIPLGWVAVTNGHYQAIGQASGPTTATCYAKTKETTTVAPTTVALTTVAPTTVAPTTGAPTITTQVSEPGSKSAPLGGKCNDVCAEDWAHSCTMFKHICDGCERCKAAVQEGVTRAK